MKQERSFNQEKPAKHFWRAQAAIVRGYVNGISAADAARQMYPDDVIAPIILRAATTQATTTDPAWAGPVARLAISEAIEDIVAMTVIGRLTLANALKVDLGRLASVRVPGRAVHAGDAGQWVQEGQAIPARQLQLLSGPTLTPTKLACLTTMTREMSETSNIEDVVERLLTEAAMISLDAAIFSAAAASGAQPAGLLNGLVALAPSTGSSGFDACGQDLGTLVADVASRGGGARAFFVAAPKQAISIRFYAGGQFYVSAQDDVLPVAASAGLADGTVICIEPESLAYSIADPQFDISTVGAIHQEDTTPTDIVVGGVPATPVKAMFQIDALALRLYLRASWGMRAPHVSFMEGVAW